SKGICEAVSQREELPPQPERRGRRSARRDQSLRGTEEQDAGSLATDRREARERRTARSIYPARASGRRHCQRLPRVPTHKRRKPAPLRQAVCNDRRRTVTQLVSRCCCAVVAFSFFGPPRFAA